jgi:hypothetical protein
MSADDSPADNSSADGSPVPAAPRRSGGSRRRFLERTSLGFGWLAFHGLLAERSFATDVSLVGTRTAGVPTVGDTVAAWVVLVSIPAPVDGS